MKKVKNGDRPDRQRRKLLQGFTQSLFLGLPVSQALAQTHTPKQPEGPFYPLRDQKDKDTDLTQIDGRSEKAQGEEIIVAGQVKTMDGKPIAGVGIEIWQANKWGRYAHVRDSNKAPLDPNFQGWGLMKTNEAGEYRFKTIYPGVYPAGPGWDRPPHIHFKLRHVDRRPLITQMYFPDEALNASDRILQNLPQQQQLMLISRRLPRDSVPHFLFDLIL